MTEIQHRHRESIISATHVHLDQRDCLLIVAVKGRVERIMDLASELMGSGCVTQLKLATLAL